jgi:multiple sugar transport system permease protein
MRDSSLTTGTTWDVPATALTSGRQTAGRLLIVGASAILLIAVVLQLLHSFGAVSFGFGDWRPVAYLYVVWSVALAVGIVLTRGERGHRALFVLPAALFTLAMVIFPTIFGLYLAFSDWNLSSTAGRQFSGFNNLSQMLRDGYFWQAMGNMVYYSLSVLVQYAIAFGLALLLNANIRGRKFFRVAFLLPFMLSPVAVSWMIGKSILDSRFGPAATLLRSLGVDNPAFFQTAWPARFSIMAMDAWYSIPFVMVLLLAGLQALPVEVLESAKVDGATGWQSFWQMTYPLMLPVSVTAVILRLIFELKLADIVINVTSGGPGGATDTVSSYIFRTYQIRSNVGYGTALAEFYLIVIIVFITVLLALVGRWLQKVA